MFEASAAAALKIGEAGMLAMNSRLDAGAEKEMGRCGTMVGALASVLLDATAEFAGRKGQHAIGMPMRRQVLVERRQGAVHLRHEIVVILPLTGVRVVSTLIREIDPRAQPAHNQGRHGPHVSSQAAFRILDLALVGTGQLPNLVTAGVGVGRCLGDEVQVRRSAPRRPLVQLAVNGLAAFVAAVAGITIRFRNAEAQTGVFVAHQRPRGLARAHGDGQLRIRVPLEGLIACPANPSVMRGGGILVGRMPDVGGRKVAVIRAGIADTGNSGKRALVEKFFEPRQLRVQSKFLVQLDDFVVLDPRCGASLDIRFMPVRHQRTQGVMIT